jgi:hypothetical protein
VADADTAPAAPATTEPDSSAAGSSKHYQDIIDKLRGRVDLTGKTLGALGTTAATAVGLKKIGDLFPIRDETHYYVWLIVALLGFVAAAAAVLYLATRLSGVGRPVFMRTDVGDMVRRGDIDEAERDGVESVFRRWAHLNGVRSLQAYEAQASRLKRTARWSGDAAERERRKALAADVESDIKNAFGLAALRVVRSRTTDAVAGTGAKVAYAAFIAGVVAFALGTDYLSSERSDRVAIGKACGEARAAGAVGAELPKWCAKPGGAASTPANADAAQQQVAVATTLMSSLKACEDAAATGPLPATACDPIRVALSAAVQKP